MNIKEAKNEVMKAVKIYLEKDEHGEYRVPVVRQRPLFLQGAPGLGKTAIMEQVASELDIALVSYSMTHHTRQSAIGLPFLKEVTYGGKTYTKSEYTMSEIIAWGDDNQEMTLFVAELTVNRNIAEFIATNKNKSYFQHNSSMLVYDQDKNLKEEIQDVLASA